MPENSQPAAHRQFSAPAAGESAALNSANVPAALAAGITLSPGASAAVAEHACRSQAGMLPVGSFGDRRAVHTHVSPSTAAAFEFRGVSAASWQRPTSLSSQHPAALAPSKPSGARQPAVRTAGAASPAVASDDPQRAAPQCRHGEAGSEGPIYPSHMLEAVPDAARSSNSTAAGQLPAPLAALTEVEALVHSGDFTSAHVNCGAAAFVDGPRRCKLWLSDFNQRIPEPY